MDRTQATKESVSEADLDSIIFSFASSRWQKTARVIVQVNKRCEELALPVDTEVLGLRILESAETNRLVKAMFGSGDIVK
jgi:hypothetical protein